jgi:hypothetical protein
MPARRWAAGSEGRRRRCGATVSQEIPRKADGSLSYLSAALIRLDRSRDQRRLIRSRPAASLCRSRLRTRWGPSDCRRSRPLRERAGGGPGPVLPPPPGARGAGSRVGPVAWVAAGDHGAGIGSPPAAPSAARLVPVRDAYRGTTSFPDGRRPVTHASGRHRYRRGACPAPPSRGLPKLRGPTHRRNGSTSFPRGAFRLPLTGATAPESRDRIGSRPTATSATITPSSSIR